MRTVNDPLPFIREHPERFLRQVPAKAHELAAGLVADAVLLTGAPATAWRGGGRWWIVGCEQDWLADSESEPLGAFRRLLPFPEAGVNSVRSEVLLTAFAEAVVTVGAEGGSIIVGDIRPGDPIWADARNNKACQRVVAFVVPDG